MMRLTIFFLPLLYSILNLPYLNFEKILRLQIYNFITFIFSNNFILNSDLFKYLPLYFIPSLIIYSTTPTPLRRRGVSYLRHRIPHPQYFENPVSQVNC